METRGKPEEIPKKVRETAINSKKPISIFLKYLDKIEHLHQSEEYIREFIKVPFIEFIIQVLILRPILILICLFALGFLPPPNVSYIPLAEGISILWYLFISLISEISGGIKNGAK